MNDSSLSRFGRLPTVAAMRAVPVPQPRPVPRVVSRWQRRDRRRAAERWLRDYVWQRDGGVSRASGATLVRGATDYRQRAAFAHLRARSTDPHDRWNPDNIILISTLEHALSDPRTAGTGAGWITIDPVDAAGELVARARLRFTRYAADGSVEGVFES